MSDTHPSAPSRSVRGHILFAIAVLLALALAWRLRTVLELVYVSALFAVVLMPIVHRTMRLKVRGWSPSRPLAIVALVAAVTLALAAVLLVGVPPVVHDIERFTQDLPQRGPAVLAHLKHLPGADKIGIDQIVQRTETVASSTAQYLVGVAPLLLGSLFDLITAFILCIYFMLEGEFAYFYFLSMFRPTTRDRLARTLKAAERRMSKWLLGRAA